MSIFQQLNRSSQEGSNIQVISNPIEEYEAKTLVLPVDCSGRAAQPLLHSFQEYTTGPLIETYHHICAFDPQVGEFDLFSDRYENPVIFLFVEDNRPRNYGTALEDPRFLVEQGLEKMAFTIGYQTWPFELCR